MSFQQKPGQFALFKNDRKESENQPDYHGNGLDLAGKPIRVAAWLKQGSKGKFMSCSMQYKDKPENAQKGPQKPAQGIDDDLPW